MLFWLLELGEYCDSCCCCCWWYSAWAWYSYCWCYSYFENFIFLNYAVFKYLKIKKSRVQVQRVEGIPKELHSVLELQAFDRALLSFQICVQTDLMKAAVQLFLKIRYYDVCYFGRFRLCQVICPF